MASGHENAHFYCANVNYWLRYVGMIIRKISCYLRKKLHDLRDLLDRNYWAFIFDNYIFLIAFFLIYLKLNLLLRQK